MFIYFLHIRVHQIPLIPASAAELISYMFCCLADWPQLSACCRHKWWL